MKTVTALGRPWAFTDQHADLGYASYFTSLADLSEIDWTVMPLTQWGGSDEIKARRQAEFLVHESFPWSGVERIGVKSTLVAARLKAMLSHGAPAPEVRPDWYY